MALGVAAFWLPVALWAPPGAPSVATDLPWYTQPAAPGPLHPVHDQPWLRWQRAMADAMSGPSASPLFRDTASSLDVYWSLLAADQNPQPPTSADAVLARDLATTGATLGLTRMLRDTVDRSETLHVVREIAHSAVSPGFAITRQDGHATLAVDTESMPPDAARAAIDQPRTQGPWPPLRERTSPVPLVRVGTGLSLVDDQTDDSAGLTQKPVPAVQAWLDLGSPGHASMRADLAWIAPWDAAPSAPPSPSPSPIPRWELLGRLPLVAGFALNLDAVGVGDTGLPLRERLGLSHTLPHQPAWMVRIGGVHLESTGPTDPEEWRVNIGLSANLGWNIPEDIDRWPLGLQPGAPGPVWPSLPDASPNVVAPVVRTPAERAVSSSPSGSGMDQAQ